MSKEKWGQNGWALDESGQEITPDTHPGEFPKDSAFRDPVLQALIEQEQKKKFHSEKQNNSFQNNKLSDDDLCKSIWDDKTFLDNRNSGMDAGRYKNKVDTILQELELRVYGGVRSDGQEIKGHGREFEFGGFAAYLPNEIDKKYVNEFAAKAKEKNTPAKEVSDVEPKQLEAAKQRSDSQRLVE